MIDLGILFDMDTKDSISLFEFEPVSPSLKDIRCHVSLHHVAVEVLGRNTFSSVCFPELKDLELLSALNVLSGLVLLCLLDVHLPPVPQVLSFLDCPYFVGAVP